MDTCHHKKCNLDFSAKPENQTSTTHKHKLATKPFGKPPFTIDDVYMRGNTFALHIVLPNGIEMAPCHPSERELLKIANSTYTILANLYSEKAMEANKSRRLSSSGALPGFSPAGRYSTHTPKYHI